VTLLISYSRLVDEYLKNLDVLQKSSKYNFSIDGKQIPKTPGLYLIYSRSRLIYVGETSNLKRRLLGDHKHNTEGSAFRIAIKKYKKMQAEKAISGYILKNCSFQFIEVEDKLRRKRLEHFAIAVLNPLLNDIAEPG